MKHAISLSVLETEYSSTKPKYDWQRDQPDQTQDWWYNILRTSYATSATLFFFFDCVCGAIGAFFFSLVCMFSFPAHESKTSLPQHLGWVNAFK